MAKSSRVHKVILDTNFLVDIVRFKVDLGSIGELLPGRYKLLIPEAVEKELKKMKSKNAKAAIKLAKLRDLKIIKNHASVRGADNMIVSLAESMQDKKSKIAVATNDAELRKRLKALGVKTIYLRARKHLEIG